MTRLVTHTTNENFDWEYSVGTVLPSLEALTLIAEECHGPTYLDWAPEWRCRDPVLEDLYVQSLPGRACSPVRCHCAGWKSASPPCSCRQLPEGALLYHGPDSACTFLDTHIPRKATTSFACGAMAARGSMSSMQSHGSSEMPTSSHRPRKSALHIPCWSLPHSVQAAFDRKLGRAGEQLKHLTSLMVAANSICITLPAALRLRRLCLVACSKLCLHFESAGESARHLQAFDIACRYLLHQEPIDALQVRLHSLNLYICTPIWYVDLSMLFWKISRG